MRIRPNVVRIDDARFLDQVYGGAGSQRSKSKVHCNSISMPRTFVATQEYELRRAHRASISHLLFKQNIRRLGQILQRCLDKMLTRFELYTSHQTPLDIRILFNASTNDMISECGFGNCWNSRDVPDRNERFFKVMVDGAKNVPCVFLLPLCDRIRQVAS